MQAHDSHRLFWSADPRTWNERCTHWLGLAAHDINWQKARGLLPVVVQDIKTRQVLMQGFMNPDALNQTLKSGQVTFFSRSKGCLWRKGEQSGHVLELRELALDCDCDSLLILALPHGPTCHTGCNSCYSRPPSPPNPKSDEHLRLGCDFGLGEGGASLGVGWLAALERIIAERLKEPQPKPKEDSDAPSYVRELFGRGIQRMAQKIGEEGVETALAAMALKHANEQANPKERAECARDELANEAADLLFHLLLLLQACGLHLQDAIQVLEQRHHRNLQER